MTTLSDLTAWPIWCVWREEVRDGKPTKLTPSSPDGSSGDENGEPGKLTKVPYGRGGFRAQSDNPGTWLTHEDARTWFEKGGWAGLGVFLGDLGEGWSLVGIDLDTCLSAEGVSDVAQAALQALGGGCCEISPSGTGLKWFGLLAASEEPGVRAALGITDGRLGMKWSDGAGEHPPSVEIYLGKRYFTVTGDGLTDDPYLGELTEARAKALAGVVRHYWKQKVVGDKGQSPMGLPGPGRVVRPDDDSTDVLAERFQAICAEQHGLAWVMAEDQGKFGTFDQSRSGYACHVARYLLWYGWPIEDIGLLFELYPHVPSHDGGLAAWVDKKGWASAGRELADLVKNAKYPRLMLPQTPGLVGPPRSAVPQPPPGPPATVVPLSDEWLAQRMVDLEGARLRYVARWGKWMLWNGIAWAADETLGGLEIARRVCTDASLPLRPRDAVKIVSARCIHAVEGLARADARVAATSEAWDQDPWLLNTPDGIVDLRTGRLMAADPTKMMTRATAVGCADLHAESPLWQTFLETVTNRDRELQYYLQRMAGYCLTGQTTEDALFFLFGGGDNGKSTFVETLVSIWGEEGYAQVTGADTFAAQRGDRHKTELARLRGARLVAANETDEGRGWNEARIKELTGGTKITANFMRQDFFTFKPEFKPLICGNHKPRIRTPDRAMARRMNLIPFSVQIPEHQKDKDLAEKLLREGPAILAWAVRGCLVWKEQGLQPPKLVREATAGYMAAEDSRTMWFEEHVRVDDPETKETERQTREMDLFTNWRAWAEKANEPPGKRADLGEWLENRGYQIGKNKIGQKVFLRLTFAPYQSPYSDANKNHGSSGGRPLLGLIPGGRSENQS